MQTYTWSISYQRMCGGLVVRLPFRGPGVLVTEDGDTIDGATGLEMLA